MPQFPANIDLSSLNGTNGFRLSGAAAGDLSGFSVASAGDVNGDGFADLIIGAESAAPNGSLSGASYVVFGAALGFGANLNLSSLNGTNGFMLSGAAAGDLSGVSVASARDVNGDGFADVIVGAFGAGPNGLHSGASYVVFGNASGFGANLELSALNGTNGFKLSGVAANDYSGWSVASAGDVNGDGFADLIIGAKFADPNGSSSGASYVVFGMASGFAANLNLSALNGSNGFRISGVAAINYSGFSVASAGDVNGDGFADLIIGANGAGPNGILSGASYVVFGAASGSAANLNLSALNGSNGFKISGVAANDYSGCSVASAGDINGDGFADIIIGANGAGPSNNLSGASYVVFGSASGFGANVNLSTLNGTNGFRISGVAAGDYSGSSVASAGDVNGDGFADLILGAWRADPNGIDSGASYVMFGAASAFAANLDLSMLNGTNGFKLSGVSAYDNSGFSVASAGDVNGDGFADVIVGAFRADPNGSNSGASYVVYGIASTTAVALTGTLADQTLSGGLLADTLSGLSGNDMLWGQAGADTLDGGSGDDMLEGGADADSLIGGLGTDTARYIHASGAIIANLASSGANTGEAAGDTYSSIENLIGTRFADTLTGDGADNVLEGGAGADTLNGGAGNNTASYSTATSGPLQAVLYDFQHNTGDAAGDVYANIQNLIGSSLSDKLFGDSAANILSGAAGSDVLFGMDGDDTLLGGNAQGGANGWNQLWGGNGSDTASYAGMNVSLYADLVATGGWELTVNGYVLTDTYNSIENLTGGNKADVLAGDAGANILEGGRGADQLYGRGGADIFVYRAFADSNVGGGYDTIADFVAGVDKIDLRAFTSFAISAANVAISSDGISTKLLVEATPGVFNASTDLAVALIGGNALTVGDIIF